MSARAEREAPEDRKICSSKQGASERSSERGKRDPRDSGGGWSTLTLFPSFSHPLAANHLHGFRQLIFTYLVGAEVSKSDCGAQENSFNILLWVATRKPALWHNSPALSSLYFYGCYGCGIVESISTLSVPGAPPRDRVAVRGAPIVFLMRG